MKRRLIYLLNVGNRRVQRWIEGRTSGAGTTAAQFGLLFVLGRKDGILMGEAGEALDLAPSAMSGLVDRTIKAGLIERRQNPDDSRMWHLWLLPAGREALERAKGGLAELNALLSHGFTEEEMDVVGRWLESLRSKFPRD